MRRTLVMSLRTQYANLGDQAIGAVLAAEWARRARVLALTDGVPADYLAGFTKLTGKLGARDLRFVTRRELPAQLLRAGRIALALSPGDIRQDRAAKMRALARWAGRMPGRPLRFVQVGASYAGVGPGNAEIFRRLAVGGDPVSVRDATSQALFAAQGADLPVIPDLAFALPVTPHGQGRRAILSFRETADVADGSRLAAIAARCRAAGYEPALFWQVGSDRELSEALAARLGVPLLNYGAPDMVGARAVYAQAALIFSNRLHALLIAGAAGAIPVATLDASEVKVRGVFEQAGWGDLVATDADADAALFARVSGDEPAQRARIAHDFGIQAAALARFFDAAVAS